MISKSKSHAKAQWRKGNGKSITRLRALHETNEIITVTRFRFYSAKYKGSLFCSIYTMAHWHKGKSKFIAPLRALRETTVAYSLLILLMNGVRRSYRDQIIQQEL